jgi:hypothetical protein
MAIKRKIETELQASYWDKALAELERTIVEVKEFEAALRQTEMQVWQSHWSFDDPMGERLARVGLDRESIRKLELLFDYLVRVGTDAEIPPEVEQRIAAMKSAETSALEQLANVVSSARRKAGPDRNLSAQA